MQNNLEKDEVKVIWKAQAGSQVAFLNCPHNEVLLHGSRGGGKTETALMAFIKYVDCGYGQRWRGVILRKSYKDLDDVIAKSEMLFPRLYPQARFLRGKGDLKWIFPNGETLMFRVFNRASDYNMFHGQELPFILWEELTNWPTDEFYQKMKSCNRSVKILDVNGDEVMGEEKAAIPLLYLSTTNPSGSGHGWVKEYFIDSGSPYAPITDRVGNIRCHIPSSVFENKFISDSYIKTLEMLTDENLRKAWLQGSWDIVAGGLFSDVWNPRHNIVEPFDVPKSWKIDRSYDAGWSKPFSVIWHAESDGTDYIDSTGESIPTIRGDIFCILEYYGSAGKNRGLKLTDRQVAVNIRDMELTHPALKGRNIRRGPADSQIWAQSTVSGVSPASEMERMGIYWVKADKGSGSREAGWHVIRGKLHNAHNGDGEPSLRIFGGDRCRDLLRLLPNAPRDEEKPDDLDTDSEDHNLDALRYRCRQRRVSAGSRRL